MEITPFQPLSDILKLLGDGCELSIAVCVNSQESTIYKNSGF